MNGPGANAEVAADIENTILNPENVKYLQSFFIDRDNIDLANIKRFFVSELSRVLLDTGLVLKMMVEHSDVFSFDGFLKTTLFGVKASPKNVSGNIVLLNIKVDPVLAPLGGQDVGQIKPGDEVIVPSFTFVSTVNATLGFVFSAETLGACGTVQTTN